MAMRAGRNARAKRIFRISLRFIEYGKNGGK
jgi:hypothetical protein